MVSTAPCRDRPRAPLGKEGYKATPGTLFVRADNMDIGVRINGNPITDANLLLLLGQ